MMEGKVRVGIIGTGSISHMHIQAYLHHPHVELCALCDINEERVKAVGEKYQIERIYTNMEEMLKLEELDAVSVCTWNSAHAPCTIAALRAGKHVLCEKPMAINSEEAINMQQEARKADKLLMIGFIKRFGDDVAVLQDYRSKGFFGDFYYAKANYLRRNGNPGGWFGDQKRSGGGPLIDLGVHIIDVSRYLMDSPKPISVYGATFSKLLDRQNIKGTKAYTSVEASKEDICDVEDLATAMIRFDNGAILSIETSFSLNLKEDQGTIELFGTKGGAKLSPKLELYSELYDYMVDINLAISTQVSFNELFEREIKHFIACIPNPSECISPAANGVALMKILDAIYQSSKTGHEVIID